MNWSDALKCVVAAIFHWSVFRADIEASTLSGHSVIDATLTPDNYLHLRESITAHRAPSLHCTTPPRSAVINVQDEAPLHQKKPPTGPSNPCTPPRMTPSRRKRHQRAAVIRSTDLGFPPEVADRGLELLHGDAFKKVMTQQGATNAGHGIKPSTRFSPGSARRTSITYCVHGSPPI